MSTRVEGNATDGRTIRSGLVALAGTLVVTLGATAGLFLLLPSYTYLATQEDHLVEVLTALAFLAAFAVAVTVMVRRPWGAYPGTLVLVALAGFIGFGEELSFGARIFGWEGPKVYYVTVDAPHDVVRIAWRYFRHIGRRTILLAGMLGVTAVAAAWLVRRYNIRPLHLVRHDPPAALLTAGAVLMAVAAGVDVLELHVPWIQAVEEVLELNASIATLLAAISVVRTRSTPAPAGGGAPTATSGSAPA